MKERRELCCFDSLSCASFLPYPCCHLNAGALLGFRQLSVVVDVSCDTTNPNNPIPFADQNTTFTNPTFTVKPRYAMASRFFRQTTQSTSKQASKKKKKKKRRRILLLLSRHFTDAHLIEQRPCVLLCCCAVVLLCCCASVLAQVLTWSPSITYQRCCQRKAATALLTTFFPPCLASRM